MKLSRPKFITWLISVIIAGIGIVATFVTVPNISGPMAHWLVIAGFVLLALGNLVKGL